MLLTDNNYLLFNMYGMNIKVTSDCCSEVPACLSSLIETGKFCGFPQNFWANSERLTQVLSLIRLFKTIFDIPHSLGYTKNLKMAKIGRNV